MSAETARARRRTMADKADIHELYEISVQNVEHEVEFLQKTFQEIRGRKAYLFREDFCGTASASCEWVKQGDDYQAIGVDIEPSVLEWGRKNRLAKLPMADQPRVSLIESDVMTAETPAPDLLAAFNFSYFIFRTRDELRAYFKKSYDALKDDGVFFIDMFGGPEAQEETKEKTKHKGIHLRLAPGEISSGDQLHPLPHPFQVSRMAQESRRRLPTNGDSGQPRSFARSSPRPAFKKATLYWEGEDEDGEGNGEFTPDEKGEADLAWIAYIVAEKVGKKLPTILVACYSNAYNAALLSAVIST